ncbi:hypothetical protein GUA87_09370 [Sneathiella sp. P13V-1]|uniref:hypothetical protein n=1 Tax=Sneathiella sp. P13V-1 TaxID=2697366 RepID=UPI00187B7285|nr:hypothetical protein [Sneathiella sp. P13V-1]MBE7637052.1 hypothetical protein [Sneathiella sp. P13V-1]
MNSKNTAEKSRSIKAIIKTAPAGNDNFPYEMLQKRLREQEENSRTTRKKPRNNSQIWTNLSEAQVKAAHRIYFGFVAKFRGLEARTQNFIWMPKGNSNPSDFTEHLIDKFTFWASYNHGTYFSVVAALDILIFGKSCREIDQAFSRRKGFAKGNLITALDEYNKIKMHHNVEKT